MLISGTFLAFFVLPLFDRPDLVLLRCGFGGFAAEPMAPGYAPAFAPLLLLVFAILFDVEKLPI